MEEKGQTNNNNKTPSKLASYQTHNKKKTQANCNLSNRHNNKKKLIRRLDKILPHIDKIMDHFDTLNPYLPQLVQYRFVTQKDKGGGERESEGVKD